MIKARSSELPAGPGNCARAGMHLQRRPIMKVSFVAIIATLCFAASMARAETIDVFDNHGGRGRRIQRALGRSRRAGRERPHCRAGANRLAPCYSAIFRATKFVSRRRRVLAFTLPGYRRPRRRCGRLTRATSWAGSISTVASLINSSGCARQTHIAISRNARLGSRAAGYAATSA